MYTEITGRTEAAVTREIIHRAARIYRETRRRTLILIPDQFSYEYEKMLYELLGPASNNMEALGFNRLCEQIEQHSRQPNHPDTGAADADSNVRVLLMDRAVRRMRTEKTALYYTKSLDKGYFIGEVLTLIDELRQAGTAPAELESAAVGLSGSVQNKALDIARLYAYFDEELSARNLRDRGGAVHNACRIAAQSNFFAGCEVFLDSFRSFTTDEIALIQVILGQAQNTCAGFLAPESNAGLNAEMSPFSLTVRTAAEIRAAAAALNLPATRIFAAEAPEQEGFEPSRQAITHIRENLFHTRPKTAENPFGVRILKARDFYEECEFVCADIHRLRRETGCKPEEIAVICRALSDYAPALETAAERYELPLFLDTDYQVSQSSLILYLSALAELLCARGFNTELLLRYMKSPLSAFSDFEVSLMEEYCITWNVRAEMWTSPFTVSGIPGKAASDQYLERLNEIRQRLVNPICKFREAVRDATAAQVCAAFYELLETQQLSKKAFSAVSRTANQNDALSGELAGDFRQIWSAFLSATDAIYRTLGDEPLRARRFFDVLRVMLSQMQVSSPPQKLGTIICADAEHSRLRGIRYAYVIGVNEGVFPQPPPNSGLFTGHDRKLLDTANVKLLKNNNRHNETERLACYLALTSAPDGVCVSYALSDEQGKRMRPSRLIAMLHGMFPALPETDAGALPLEFYCTGKKAAFYAYALHTDAPPAQKAAVRKALSADPLYAESLHYLDEAASGAEYSLAPEISAAMFFPENLWTSASKADLYYRCPFLYFCRYGMRLYSPAPADFNPINAGNIIHGLLEALMSVKDSKGKQAYNPDFPQFAQEELQEKISAFFQHYVDTELGGAFGKTKRFAFLLGRLEKTALDVVQNIQLELKNSKFVPAAFEYNLVENGQSRLEIRIGGDLTIKINGRIDRVDLYRDENNVEWVKIVDYKTGTKELKLEDVYNGQNLQMLLYLLALTASGNVQGSHRNLRPAGIVYMPAGAAQDYSKKPGDTSEEAVRLRKLASYRRNGIVAESNEIITAMDTRQSGWFSPGSDGKGKDFTVISEPMLKAAAEFAGDKIRQFGDSLKNGEIAAMPAGSEGRLPCSYCEYAAVCGQFRRHDAKMIAKTDRDTLLYELEQSCKNHSPKQGGRS